MTKSKFLAGCAAAALSVFAFGGPASAATSFTYNGVSVPIGVTATVTPPHESAYVGQIKLNGSGPNAGDTAWLYCLDLYNNLAGSDTFSLNVQSTVTGATIPHAASGGGDLSLTQQQVQQIGAVIYFGFDASGGATNTAATQAFSAATQLAIWNLEYGPGSYTYGTGSVNLTNINPGSDTAAIQSNYNLLMGGVASPGSGFLSQLYDVTLYTPDKNNSQDLTFAAVHVNVNTTPLPAAFPLFASGMIGFGYLAMRRKKRKVSLAA